MIALRRPSVRGTRKTSLHAKSPLRCRILPVNFSVRGEKIHVVLWGEGPQSVPLLHQKFGLELGRWNRPSVVSKP